MRRRDFLGLSAGASLLAIRSSAWAATTGDAAPKRLVVVLLRGAVDGLNVIVPHGDEAYYAARPTIAIAKPGTEDGALALDEHFGLHPALAGLMPLWEARQLAFVHAAGSPDPTRSHFDAQLFIENGAPGRRAVADGWMNRLLAAIPGLVRGPTEAVAVGPVLPQILKGRMPVANLPLGPAAATPLAIDKPEVASAFDRLYAAKDAIGQAYRQGRMARAELIAGLPAPPDPADSGAPAPNGFPAIAARLAGLMAHDRKIRLAVVSLGGWDTHVRQGNHAGQLAERLRPLGDGLAAFAKALGQDWQNTAVVVLSEFGRTVRENGDAGTDHGHGNAIWVLGGAVQGGRIYGEWPGLASEALYEGRDLAITTDFRAVLTVVATRHLRSPDRALSAIFPDFSPTHSGLDRLIA
ncbi:MAG: DUF1501 domain-containing protein [Alphaproteobacteria bacterium]|nr:DUF1501 domain-containing protein [Alphaproteobacteria bacterium]